jgi:hypothetical protein
MDLKTVYQHDPNIVTRLIAGEMILVPIRKHIGEIDFIYTLNETAARVWELIDGDRSLGQICQQITAEFDIDPEQAKNDLHELILGLKEFNAIVEK